jgi:hypothetical protein
VRAPGAQNRALFPGHIAEVCAIRGRLRVLTCGRVANGLLDLIRGFLPIGFVEHVGHIFWQWHEIRPILAGTKQNKRGPLSSVDQL